MAQEGMNHTGVAVARVVGRGVVDDLRSDSEARVQLAKTMRCGEAAGSVSHLPAEILMQIFSYIHPTSPVQAGSLMLACRYWHDVLLRTSVLWAHLAESPWTMNDISIRVHPKRLAAFKFAVAHSGTLVLDLTFTGMGQPLSVFLTCHRFRVSSITLSVVLPKELIESLHPLLSGGEIPNLESLVIKQRRGPEYRTQTPTMPYPHLHEASLPRLHTLHLTGRHFSIKAPLRSLRHLTLTQCLWTGCGCGGFPFDSLMCVLVNFPDLETLTMHLSIPAMGEATRRVRLNALQKLTISDYSTAVGDLLALLDIPRDTILDISIPDDDTEMYAHALPPKVRSTLLAVCAAESLHVRLRGSVPAMHVRTRIGGALRLSMVSRSILFTLEGILSHLQAIFTPVTSLTTLFLDISDDVNASLSTLHDLLSMPALFSTVGILGPDGRKALLPFMASAEGKRALGSLKHLYLTWNSLLDREFHSVGRLHDSDPSSDDTEGALPGPYGAQACEAFCARLTPVLAMDPYADMLETLHVLIVKHEPPPNGIVWDIGAIQERLSARLGHMVRVAASWYVPEEELESTLLGV